MRAEFAASTDPVARLEIQRAWLRPFITALGYAREPIAHSGEEDRIVPLAGETKFNNRPYVWLIEALNPTNDPADPLTLPVAREQITDSGEVQWTEDATWEDLQYEIYVRQAIEAGLKDSREGRTVPLEEARRRLETAQRQR